MQFFLIYMREEGMKGRRFDNIEEIKKNREELWPISKGEYKKMFRTVEQMY